MAGRPHDPRGGGGSGRHGGGRREEPGPRHQAREAAVQVLYALDATGGRDVTAVDAAINGYWANFDGPALGRPYADTLVRGVMAARDALDEAIRAANPAWRIERMARVDRNIIRLAAFELSGDDADRVPPSVAIDEAVELAKRFGGEESPAFVNGTLDKLARTRGSL